MSTREPIFNWPVVAALIVAGGLIWLVKVVVRGVIEGSLDMWGWTGAIAAFLCIGTLSLTYAYFVDRRAGNLPGWLPRWMQPPNQH